MANESPQKQDQWDRIGEAVFDGIYKLILIFINGFKELFNYSAGQSFYFITVMLGITVISVKTCWHVKLFYYIFDNDFGAYVHNAIIGKYEGEHLINLMIIEFFLVVFSLGIKAISRKKKWKQFFESCNLKNGQGTYPALVNITKDGEYKTSYLFKGNGVGLDRFRSSKDSFESLLMKNISKIENGKDPSIIKVTTNTKVLSSHLTYSDVSGKLPLKDYEFYLGDTIDGPRKTNLSKLPHLVIAGTTGGGKSSFFKQTLVELLNSSNHLQMYLVDLKGGLEFSDFKKSPNAKIVKSMEDAVTILELICAEMSKRFNYLERGGYKSIIPKRDKLDRIVVAVDEASVLYANRDKNSFDYELSLQAREMTDRIAKLGRAAGIHLILATQKVSKETISTSIQENISARMCFKMNTLQGSLALLGDKSAMDLPAIAGRGIWMHGNDSFIVQAPYIEDSEIKEQCEGIEVDLHSKMLGIVQENEQLSKLTKALSDSEIHHD
mgnify:FL=1